MNDLKNTNPQQMLEDAFRALYEKDSTDEAARIEAENNLNAYQIRWCEEFKKVFSFVSQYGGQLVTHMSSDYEVKLYHCDKCSIQVFGEGYSIEVHPPKPGEEKCRCLERYLFDSPLNKELYLTLPEITTHVSKGLAKANADHKHLHQ